MHDIKTLIVDDSRAMLEVAQATLQEVSIAEVFTATSGEEALSALHNASPPFDLIFIDLNMPGMDGIELIRNLHQRRYEGGTVILSALDEKTLQLAEHVTLSMRIRLLSCISKPITTEKVETILHKMKTMRTIYRDHFSQLNESEINNALNRNQLTPYYQPKVSNADGKVMGLEVLARINSPLQTNAITPDQFIQVAEKLDLIEVITYNLMDQVLTDLPQFHQVFGPNCQISINLSPSSLHHSNLPEQLLALTERHNISPKQITLEITENIAIEDPEQLATLSRLKIKGFELALDDFGTGFTNIQQLTSLPYNEIKLDRSLIFNIANDRLSQVIMQSLLNIFQEFNTVIVAEGIDNEADLNYLNALPMPIQLQGYILSKPKAVDEICRWHRSWQQMVQEVQ